MTDEAWTTMRLLTSTRDELARLGGKDDTFDDIIQRLIKFWKEAQGR